MIEKLMALKGKKNKMSDVDQNAKMSVLKDLSAAAGASMGDKLKGLKKVSVLADSKEGLKEGIHKADELLDPEQAEMEGDVEEGSDEPAMKSHGEDLPVEHAMEEDEELEELSPEEVDSMLEKLKELKQKHLQARMMK